MSSGIETMTLLKSLRTRKEKKRTAAGIGQSASFFSQYVETFMNSRTLYFYTAFDFPALFYKRFCRRLSNRFIVKSGMSGPMFAGIKHKKTVRLAGQMNIRSIHH